MDPIRIFVGGTGEHDLPTRVLEHSIRRRMADPDRLRFVRLWDSAVEIPVPKSPQNRGRTTFSFQRFIIPEECGFTGRAIYLDSDMIVLADIAELFDSPFPEGVKVLSTADNWQTAVLLIDCSVGWRVGDLIDSLDRGDCTYQQLMNCRTPALSGGFARTLHAGWNHGDYMNSETRLLHFTAMATQPWLRAGHPFSRTWERELSSALEAGVITPGDVWRSIDEKWVRPTLGRLVDPTYAGTDAEFVPPHERGRQ